MSTALVPDNILRELTRMWTSLAKTDDGSQGGGVLRACSLTLVVLAAPDEDASSLGETLAALMPRHPARTIVIRLSGSQQPAAAVTAQCWMPFGQRRQVCAEQIEITAAENALDDVASVLSPIAAPDLPMVLWRRGTEAIGAASLGRLAALPTRAIVDSAQWPDPQGAVRHLAEIARGMHLGDLSWTRLTRWREILCQVFENQKYAERIPEITHARVTYGGTAVPVEAYYMTAWLSGSLRQGGARAEVALARDAGGAAQLLAVDLSAGAFTVSLTRLRETLIAAIDGVSHCTNLPELSDYLLMNEELDIMGADPVFERTLAAAALL